jgi:hypothetical protein
VDVYCVVALAAQVPADLEEVYYLLLALAAQVLVD